MEKSEMKLIWKLSEENVKIKYDINKNKIFKYLPQNNLILFANNKTIKIIKIKNIIKKKNIYKFIYQIKITRKDIKNLKDSNLYFKNYFSMKKIIKDLKIKKKIKKAEKKQSSILSSLNYFNERKFIFSKNNYKLLLKRVNCSYGNIFIKKIDFIELNKILILLILNNYGNFKIVFFKLSEKIFLEIDYDFKDNKKNGFYKDVKFYKGISDKVNFFFFAIFEKENNFFLELWNFDCKKNQLFFKSSKSLNFEIFNKEILFFENKDVFILEKNYNLWKISIFKKNNKFQFSSKSKLLNLRKIFEINNYIVYLPHKVLKINDNFIFIFLNSIFILNSEKKKLLLIYKSLDNILDIKYKNFFMYIFHSQKIRKIQFFFDLKNFGINSEKEKIGEINNFENNKNIYLAKNIILKNEFIDKNCLEYICIENSENFLNFFVIALSEHLYEKNLDLLIFQNPCKIENFDNLNFKTKIEELILFFLPEIIDSKNFDEIIKFDSIFPNQIKYKILYNIAFFFKQNLNIKKYKLYFLKEFLKNSKISKFLETRKNKCIVKNCDQECFFNLDWLNIECKEKHVLIFLLDSFNFCENKEDFFYCQRCLFFYEKSGFCVLCDNFLF